MPDTKIATCCYCGMRSTLRPTARDGHALACRSCGAALTSMKPLRPEAARQAARHPGAPHPIRMKKSGNRKRKKRKGLLHRIVEEVWDEIEDIFD